MAVQETWAPVVGFEALYEVSDRGRVRRSAPGKGTRSGTILTPKICRKGYHRIRLSVDGRQTSHQVHRLVAFAFIGPPPIPERWQINHRDGDKANNTPANLEWCTGSENMVHAFATGLKAGLVGADNGRTKLTDADRRRICELAGSEPKVVTAARFGISGVRVGQIQRAATAMEAA